MRRSARRPLIGLLTASALITWPAACAAAAVHAGSVAAVNLLANPGAQAGAASAHGWDSVTIPGWQIVRGLPTVVRYGSRGGQLFIGGLGGTAVLRQTVPLRSPHGGLVGHGTSYVLSGWLGGTRTGQASATIRFWSAAGRLLGSARIGPVGSQARAGRPGLTHHAIAGLLPPGTARAQVDLLLATSLRGADGPDGAGVGYNRAVADGLRLTVSAAVRHRAPVRPPVARVPRYRHVFVFYLENQDFRALIGDTRRAPYLNSLLPHASLLANFFAEEHPSDGNYLALAGGSTFGVPLTDPLEENPRYVIHARNVTDLINAAGLTWKGYLQSADGPCDDTVHRTYWDDDLPLMYFADIIDRPAYCAAHVVPLEALHADLASAASTPSFSWIGSNDCQDMEGCGIHSGDLFLKAELGAIMASPAWRTQRSLAIITVDEDNYDHPHPPQRVPTLLLGSSGVRRGYVSPVRYTHYSLLATIEAALGLGTLTANDRYAQPVNDAFLPAAASPPGQSQHGQTQPRQASHSTASHSTAKRATPRPRTSGSGYGGWSPQRPVTPARPAGAGDNAAATDTTAFVVNSGSGTVTPIDTVTRKAGHPIRVGADPAAIVATPDGQTLYVANAGSGSVTPIDATTQRAGRPIKVGRNPRALAITPDGSTVYVANSGSGTVTPISTASGLAGQPIAVGRYPRAVAVSPDGSVAYALDWGSAQVTPISTSEHQAGPPIAVGSYPFAIAFTPDSSRAYVASYGADTVTPIMVRTATAGQPVPVGAAPDSLAVSRDGRTVYVVSGDTDALTPISVATGLAGRPVMVGYSPADVAISRSGSTAFVVNTISGTVTPVATATGKAATPIQVGPYGYPVVIGIDPAAPLAVVLNTYGGRACLVNTGTHAVLARIKVGGSPLAVAFAR